MNDKTKLTFQSKQMIKQAVQNVVLPVCYTMHRSDAVDPKLIVFADAHHDSRPPAMELLYQRLKKETSVRLVEHYLDYGKAGASAVARHSMEFMKLYAKAGCVVICDNFLPAASCRKRPETKVVQLWHACGCYKKFGYDAKDDIPENYHGANVYRNANLVTVSGNAAIPAFSSAMRLPKRCVRAVGVSRTDLYFDETWKEDCRRKFYAMYPEAKGKKVVLWAPTFRGNAGAPVRIPLDAEALQQELGDEYLVLTKLHPHMMKDPRNCPILTEELYPVVDVLIADYSSLIYEYLLFEKPIVLYVPDLDAYRRERGFYMDISEIPGEIIETETALPDAIRQAAGLPDAAGMTDLSGMINAAGKETIINRSGNIDIMETRRSAFMKEYMGACDGNSTERIARWILRGNGSAPKKAP